MDAWSSMPSATGMGVSEMGAARWRISASMADTVFCTVAKPVRFWPIGVRKRGRSDMPGDMIFIVR
ncbi:hypothetical protein D3C86_2203870 [compost metagenome]